MSVLGFCSILTAPLPARVTNLAATRCSQDLPVVMGCFDGHEFRNAIKIGDVPGCKGSKGDQVVQGPTDVDHHLTGRAFLKAVIWQFGHQNFHRICGCENRKRLFELKLSTSCFCELAGDWNRSSGARRLYPCGLCSVRAWPDSSAGRSEAWAPCHCWCPAGRAEWAASSPAPSPRCWAPMATSKEQPTPAPLVLGWSHQFQHHFNSRTHFCLKLQ